ncbi:hypothetical protein cypCar_00047317, partial [Cyprinus carpio]
LPYSATTPLLQPCTTPSCYGLHGTPAIATLPATAALHSLHYEVTWHYTPATPALYTCTNPCTAASTPLLPPALQPCYTCTDTLLHLHYTPLRTACTTPALTPLAYSCTTPLLHLPLHPCYSLHYPAYSCYYTPALRLQANTSCDVSENCVVDEDQSLEALIDFRTMTIVQSYQDVLSEVSRLRSVVQSQSELVRRMRERPALPVFRIAASAVPVQCLDDVQTNSEPVRAVVPRPPSAPPLPSTPDGLQETCLKDPWTVPRPAPLGSPGVRLNPTLRMSSLDDSSWSFPSPPRPSDALFWDQTTPKSPAGDWAQPH